MSGRVPPHIADNEGTDTRLIWPFKHFADPRIKPAPGQFPMQGHRSLAQVMEDEK